MEDLDAAAKSQARRYLEEHCETIYRRTDRMFAGLMLFQWAGAICAAYWISPLTWAGAHSRTHLHVYAALFLGGAITLFPVALALLRPGRVFTRHVVASGQVLMSALLIHLSGGRIETHFHVFGSLAFLAFYRDWKVLIPATVIVAVDHILRGIYWPQSVYGVLTASEWRWLEHAAWVLFEDFFLVLSIRQSLDEMRDIAVSRVMMERTKDYIGNIIGSMADAVIVVNPDLTIRTVNQAALRLLGYDEAQLLGKPVRILAETDAEALFRGDHLENLMREGAIRDLRSSFQAKNGGRIPVSLSGAVMRGLDAHNVGIVCIARDTREILRLQEQERNLQVAAASEKARAEILQERSHELLTAYEALKKTEEGLRKLSAAMEQTADGVFITDNKGVIEYVNPAFTALTGYSREDAVGRKPSLLKSGRYDRRFYDELWETILAGRVWTGTVDNRKKDGALLTVEQTISPIRDAQGQITHFVSTTKDVTERKRLETMVLQSEKMAAVGQLAAGVAHEINNPLGIMLGFAQSLAKRINADDPLSLPVRSIEREAVRCRNLVQNLLTFSRKNEPQKLEYDLNETLTNTLNIIAAQARIKSVAVLQELAPLPPLIGDKNQIQQVVVNLCNNAMDAMPNGGKIIVRTREDVAEGKRRIVIEIEDSGSGIPEDIRNKVFNPFFTTKAVGKGTGLGLSLVHEIIQKHKGSIELKSVVGRGTTFCVALPCQGFAE